MDNNNNNPVSFLVTIQGRLVLYTPGEPAIYLPRDPQLIQELGQMDVQALIPNPLENLAASDAPLPQIQHHVPLPPLQVQPLPPQVQPPPPQVQHHDPELVDNDPIRDICKLFKEDDVAPPLDMTDHAVDLAESVEECK